MAGATCAPWAFSEDHFMVANKTAIELLNGQGETEVLYRLPDDLAERDQHLTGFGQGLAGERADAFASGRLDVVAPEEHDGGDHAQWQHHALAEPGGAVEPGQPSA